MDTPRPNKHAAKARKHIYSSGAAGTGGKAEPTNAKNAGQPIDCPFCDRIFKQDGRLKEHVKKQHADGVNRKTGGAADAAPVDGSLPATRGFPGASDVEAAKPKYFVKSAKQLLSEWCQKQNRPMPKYKAVEVEGGMFRCRVVIPDTKDSGKDTLLWWNDGATSVEAAQQAAAVAGLHAVAGERRLDRILPEEYRQQWRGMEERAAEQAERTRRQAEKKAAAARRPPPPKRTVQSVFMSEDNRQLVEGLIRESHPGRVEHEETKSDGKGLTWEATTGTTTDNDHALSSADAGNGCTSADDVFQRLRVMGFAHADIQEALRVERTGVNFSGLVDWLVLHLPESRLPKNFRPEASGSHVEVLRRDDSGKSSGRTQGPAVERACQDVIDRGYAQAEAEAALRGTGGDVDLALCALSRGVADGTATSRDGPGAEARCSGEHLEDERVALEAIYGEDFKEAMAEGAPLLAKWSVRLPATEAWGERTSIEFRFPPDTRYPEEAPCIAFRNGAAPPDWLRRLTELSLSRAQELRGEAMLWALVEAAKEDASAAHKDPGTAPQRARGGERGGTHGVTDRGQQCLTVGEACVRDNQEARRRGEEPSGRPASRESARAAPCKAARSSNHRESMPSPSAVDRESTRLQQHWQAWLHEGRYASMRQTRAALPAAQQRSQLMRAVDGADSGERALRRAEPRVTIVCGQTGCGKSTQVPQYILEDWIAGNSGGRCNVIVTQPRRVAAIGLAERVAAERGEKVGGTVGYSVRLDSQQSASTRLLFCTTGVLLRRMQSDPRLAGLTHVVVDEVHERTLEGDLTLLLLRTLVADVRKDLAVVLMSATADANELAAYFSAGPLQDGKAAVGVVSIPGFTHPVRELFLEDVLEWTGEVIGAKSRYAKRKGVGRKDSAPGGGRKGEMQAPSWDTNGLATSKEVNETEWTGPETIAGVRPVVKESWESDDDGEKTEWQDAAESGKLMGGQKPERAGRGDTGALRDFSAQQSGSGHGGTSWAREEAGSVEAQYSEPTRRSLEHVDEAVLNYELLEAVVCKILDEEQRPTSRYAPLLPALPPGTPDPVQAAGGILVFLPGMAEIRRLERQLATSQRLAAAYHGRLRVLPLHGSLSGEQQRRVFDRLPPGHRKVVLSTNVAETSLTIDDVTYVVDTGRQREMGFDPNRALACLEDVWVSQAAAQQRRGRAGRTRPGCCIRLFSRRTFDSMAQQQLPEVLRTALDQLCLQVKSLLPARPIASVLGDLLSPPAPAVVASALSTLVQLHALCPNPETLAPLGRHLARMPVDVRVGKMLVFSALMGCPGPACTIAAALTGKSPFTAVPPDMREEADRAKARFAGSWRSDHLAVVAAFDGWKEAGEAGEAGGWRRQQDFCQSHFLSREALQAIDASRTDYLSCLADLGFLPRFFAWGATPGQLDCDVNAHNYRVVKAVLCAGFYPNVVRVQLPEALYKETSSGAVAKDAHAREVRFYTQHDGRVFLHPASTNFSVGRFESPWLVYSEKVQTSKIFIRESSMVPAYALLLFGGDIHVAHEQQRITIDGWMQFEAPARIAVLIRELRAQLDKLLAEKIENPALDVRKQKVVEAAVKLLTHDGF